MPKKKEPAALVNTEPVFSKEQLIGSKRFEANRDILAAVLKDGAKCTIKEAETLVKDFLKGEVK